MLKVVPKDIMILGGGLDWVGDGEDSRLRLKPRSVERVERTLRYLQAHPEVLARRARILCSGGFSKSDAAQCLNDAWREGNQMASMLMAAGLDHRRIYVDDRPANTVENFTLAIQDRLIEPGAYNRQEPLGIVTQAWHYGRVAYTAVHADPYLGPGNIRHIDAGNNFLPDVGYQRDSLKILEIAIGDRYGHEAVQDRVPMLDAMMEARFGQSVKPDADQELDAEPQLPLAS